MATRDDRRRRKTTKYTTTATTSSNTSDMTTATTTTTFEPALLRDCKQLLNANAPILRPYSRPAIQL